MTPCNPQVYDRVHPVYADHPHFRQTGRVSLIDHSIASTCYWVRWADGSTSYEDRDDFRVDYQYRRMPWHPQRAWRRSLRAWRRSLRLKR